MLGIPLAAVFERREIGRARSHALGGAMILLLVVVAIYVAGIAGGAAQVAWQDLALLAEFATTGATMGLTYWIIARPVRQLSVDPRQVESIFR